MIGVTAELDTRRRDLGMSCKTLARRAGVGLATVQRALTRGHATAGTLVKLATALGVSMHVAPLKTPTTMREEQARDKAQRLVALVQGTSALEAQAVDRKSFEAMLERTVVELLKGPNLRLWED
jgi:lambda repressor-like predicted transcriptional regulator